MKNRYYFRPGGTPSTQMLDAYVQAVYYQLTVCRASANLAPTLPEAFAL
jgi:hypothetical protein